MIEKLMYLGSFKKVKLTVPFDRYYVDDGDIITDQREADGKSHGLVYFRRELPNGTLEDVPVTIGVRRPGAAANTYTSSDGRITYELNGTTLTVIFNPPVPLPKQTITIQDYQPGDLNIHLLDVGEAADRLVGTENNDRIEFTERGTPAGLFLDTTLTTLEDVSAVSNWVDTADTLHAQIENLQQQIADAQQNNEDTTALEAQLAQVQADYDNTFGRLLDQNGGDLPRLIETLGGNDVVVLHDAPGFNNIVVDGGAGNDFLSAGDISFTGYQNILIHLGASYVMPTSETGQGYTLLGGADNDVLLGGKRDDVLEGGDGDDIVFGGGNNVDMQWRMVA